ncbi:MAG: LacI family transcriptional regulator [Meiothermus sp.]|uniref:LacI family DNA-binding transcriptional regulator n=1 Tax=Meiothermus sp. TaxID=1955249 RepID=UPI0025CD451E|nr:LacI family DNA-binding transcriptional regulator [Meiothermus sp.]MCS7057489.1 LacI family transcriptional regulator [Meiothermus sp.]MCX7739589.1 LacI family transcriptional regulator [Meiothermus sp.]MDW8482464.1 LacI family DNA-binding transcriptional regulator [Meiothermus sp.]
MIKIADVARAAQVSPSTVSRALTKPDLVAPETRERVLQAARQLGYQPNKLARGLRKQQSRLLGLIVSDILAPFHATLAKGVQDAAEKHGYMVFLFNSDEQPEKEARYLQELQSHWPEGLLIVPTAKTRQHLRNLRGARSMPVIELDRTSGTPGVHAVLVENVLGAREAVEHLIALGHRRIGMITGEPVITTAQERLEGYRQALKGAGITPDERLVANGYHKEEGGYAAALQLLRLPPQERPTALFVGNSEMAAGAVQAIRDLGLRIPEDISLVSFDDTRWAQLMEPALTVVAQPAYEIGYLACETLVSLLRQKAPAEGRILRLKTRLLIRQSTARPRLGG